MSLSNNVLASGISLDTASFANMLMGRYARTGQEIEHLLTYKMVQQLAV